MINKMKKTGKIQWRPSGETPDPDRECLCETKHGLISGYWREKDECFSTYFFREIEFCARRWCYMDEVEFIKEE